MPELQDELLNREPVLKHLISSFLTLEDGYDRNHSVVPDLKGKDHHVRVDGAVDNILELSMSDLANKFDQHSVVSALQCAGNRRHTLRTAAKDCQGIDWFDAAVMNCKWTGPRVKDILESAKVSPVKDAHVAFSCCLEPCQEDTWYGSSIPLSRVLREDADVILAIKMNDEALTVEHGFPVRVIIPGVAGARAVKWLDKITVQAQESDNFYMQRDYKLLPEEAVDAETAKKFWPTSPPVQEMPVNSVIGVPENGASVERDDQGRVQVQGYALPSGDNGPIVKVELSTDDGQTWQEAELLQHELDSKWAWKLWQANVPIQPGDGRVVHSRATDAAGNTQPRTSPWNLRGICWHGYGEVSGLNVQ